MSEESLPLPVGDVDPEPATVAVDPQPMAASAADDQGALDSSYNKTIRALRAQKLVRVRVPEGGLYVQINGWKSSYAAGVHMVPEQVEQIWIDAKRI